VETRNVKTGREVIKRCCLSPNLFKLYSAYFTIGVLEAFVDLKMAKQVIHCVKYADAIVLVAKKEAVVQSILESLTEIGKCYGN
jgi:hypothetical protein